MRGGPPFGRDSLARLAVIDHFQKVESDDTVHHVSGENPAGGAAVNGTIMMAAVKNAQLTREDWIAIAREALIASGVDDVKVDVLARRLKVTRGSFYWHFKSRQELLNALLEDWEANNRREIAVIEALVETEGNGMLTELFRIWLGEDPSFPAFDIAIRAWARKAPAVLKLMREIDEAWIALFQAHLERVGMTAPESFVRARIMYFHQVGYFALAINEGLADRVKLAPYYYAALTGLQPPEGLADDLLALAQPKKRSGSARAGGAARQATAKRQK
jgi:AcrR family transcriptional regulator